MNLEAFNDRYPEHFVEQCRIDQQRHPRRPVACTEQTAKDIDVSGIFKMTPDQVGKAPSELVAA